MPNSHFSLKQSTTGGCSSGLECQANMPEVLGSNQKPKKNGQIMPDVVYIILALAMWRQESQEFKVSLRQTRPTSCQAT